MPRPVKHPVLPFNYGTQPIRVMHQNGGVWFVAKDVCDALGITDFKQAVGRLEDYERTAVQIDTPGGPQYVKAISESGLYSLVLRSNSGAAKPFRRWVTSEVLPVIRKTGSYAVGASGGRPAVALPVQAPLALPAPPPAPETVQITKDEYIGLLKDQVALYKTLPTVHRRQPRQVWTPQDDSRVQSMHAAGETVREIAFALGRNYDATRHRINKVCKGVAHV